jgi:hypothetical protein
MHRCNNTPESSNTSSNKKVAHGKLIVQAYLYEREKLIVTINDSIFFMRSRKPGGIDRFVERIPLPADRVFSIKVQTQYGDKTYIDTLITVGTYDSKANLRIAVTVPFPYDYPKYMKNGVQKKSWGTLPIDSSLRFFHFRTE